MDSDDLLWRTVEGFFTCLDLVTIHVRVLYLDVSLSRCKFARNGQFVNLPAIEKAELTFRSSLALLLPSFLGPPLFATKVPNEAPPEEAGLGIRLVWVHSGRKTELNRSFTDFSNSGNAYYSVTMTTIEYASHGPVEPFHVPHVKQRVSGCVEKN